MLPAMDRIATFFAMGGYAAYVWPAFAITAIVMTGLLVETLRTLHRRERELAELEAAQPGRIRER